MWIKIKINITIATVIGFVLALVTDNLVSGLLHMLIPTSFIEQPYVSSIVHMIHILLFYLVTLFCGRLLKKLLLSGKSVLRLQQTWYLFDAGLLLLITIYLFDDLIPGQNGSVGKLIYNNVLHISGYLFVMLFLLLAVHCSYLEKMQTEAKQKAMQDLQDYTHNLEAMYNGLRSFKHDYINILLSMSGYIANSDIDELKRYFETKIFPTKDLIDQGDYKLNQLGNIDVLEIKNLLSAKMIYAHESGIDVTIDIPCRVDSFQDQGAVLHKLKQKGFTTKTGHQGIGLSNARKIITSYDNALLETSMLNGRFTQHLELTDRKK